MVQTLKDGVTNPHSTEDLEEDVRGVFLQRQGGLRLELDLHVRHGHTDAKESQIVGKGRRDCASGCRGKSPIGTVNGRDGPRIPTSSQNKDAAWDYIKFLASPDIEAKYAASSPPIWKSFYEEAAKQTRPDADLMAAEAASFNALSNRRRCPIISSSPPVCSRPSNRPCSARRRRRMR